MLSVQPTLEAGQLQIKDMKLAMRAGKSRHYKVADIQGRHFMETGLAAGFSRAQILQIFDEIRASADRAFASALADMPAGFPAALGDDIRRGFDQRLPRLVAKAD